MAVKFAKVGNDLGKRIVKRPMSKIVKAISPVSRDRESERVFFRGVSGASASISSDDGFMEFLKKHGVASDPQFVTSAAIAA
jgi:hypothetical protein